eukprot:COSAG01_NODE_1232_length_11111_cov_24.710770_2_plen_144_part_00
MGTAAARVGARAAAVAAAMAIGAVARHESARHAGAMVRAERPEERQGRAPQQAVCGGEGRPPSAASAAAAAAGSEADVVADSWEDEADIDIHSDAAGEEGEEGEGDGSARGLLRPLRLQSVEDYSRFSADGGPPGVSILGGPL